MPNITTNHAITYTTFPWEENGEKDNLPSCSLLTLSNPPYKRFRNPGYFYCWIRNQANVYFGFGILGLEIRNTAQGKQNPTNDWSPESTFLRQTIQNLVPGILNLRLGIQENGEKDNLPSCSLLTLSNPPYKRFRNPGYFYCWIRNQANVYFGFGILGLEIRNTAQGKQNPTNDWSPESTFLRQTIQNLVPGILNLRLGIQTLRLFWKFFYGANQ